MTGRLDGDTSEQPRLRVASVTRRLTVAGDETRLLHTAVAFDKNRVDHVVIVISPPEEDAERLGPMRQRYAEAGVEVVELALELRSGRGALNALRIVRRLVRELRFRDIDVFDGRLGTPTAFGMLAAPLARVPVLVCTAYYPGIWGGPLRTLLGQACLARVDALVSDAEATLAEFDRWRWSKHAELVHIPNGVPEASSAVERAQARAVLGLPTSSDVRVVGQVSRMIPRKGYETFLRAARIVAAAEPSVAFVGVGFVAEDRALFDELIDLRAELGLNDDVRLLSYEGPIGDVFAALDVFAHLSVEDSSPITIHEAMSAGLPAVLTSLPGNLELATDEETALMVPAEDPVRTAAAILRLLRDPELARRLGEASRQRYGQRHRPRAMAAAHESLFQRLLAARSKRRSERKLGFRRHSG